MSDYYKKSDKAIEPINFIGSHCMNFAEGNVVKYICRYKYKNSKACRQIEDLEKAKKYIDYIISNLKDK